MKKLALILALFTAFAFSAECNQISDQISIKFLCTDGQLITLRVNDVQDTYKVLNGINVTVDNKDGTYTITEHLSNFKDEKCKSKYLFFKDVYDEFGIRISGTEKCTNDASYSPTAVWNNLHGHHTCHKMTK